jgi:hypothetical protein
METDSSFVGIEQCCGSGPGSVESVCFLGFPDPLFGGLDPDPSINKQK